MTKLKIIAIAVLGVVLSAPMVGASGRYSVFGNGSLDDCQYESIANLVLYEFPSAVVTESEVVGAFRSNGVAGAIPYIEGYGFDGHHVASLTAINPHNRAEISYAAAHGGVWATVSFGQHVLDIIHADSSGLTILDDGTIYHDTWSDFWYFQNTPVVDYAVTWAAPNTEQLNFVSSYTSGSMSSQVEPTGTVAPIEPLGYVNDGYTFEGWQVEGEGPLLAGGSTFTFTQSATLYAVWTYTGVSA